MKAESYTIEHNTTTFHYSFAELRDFIMKGRNIPVMDFLLIKVIGDMKYYKGYLRQYNDVVVRMKVVEQIDPFHQIKFNPKHQLKSYIPNPVTIPYKFDIMYFGDKN